MPSVGEKDLELLEPLVVTSQGIMQDLPRYILANMYAAVTMNRFVPSIKSRSC